MSVKDHRKAAGEPPRHIAALGGHVAAAVPRAAKWHPFGDSNLSK
jgi:hypothetical protein